MGEGDRDEVWDELRGFVMSFAVLNRGGCHDYAKALHYKVRVCYHDAIVVRARPAFVPLAYRIIF